MTHPAITTITQEISRFPGVLKLILFGSRATGKAGSFSDIDLAVVGVENNDEWAEIRELAESTRTLLKIDLMRFEKVDQAVQESILKEGIILYERAAGESGD